jgi:uncharacterized protein with GYD domain
MKHMVVNTHNAESCAFRNEEDGEAMLGALDALGNAWSELGATLEGFWVNRSAHTFFILVDAPNAHVIDEAMLKASLIGRTHTEIFPVLSLDEVRESLQAQSSS